MVPNNEVECIRPTETDSEPGSAHGMLFRAALLILLFMTSTLVASSLSFLFHSTFPALVLVASTVCGLTMYFILFRRVSLDSQLSGLAVAAAVIALSLAMSTAVVDTTYDGNSYHKFAIGHLSNGWNPLVESSAVYAERQPFLDGLRPYSIWVDHYGKATWQIGAQFYTLTGNIEAAKAFNLLAVFAVFGMAAHILRERGMSGWQSYSVALLLAINPITIVQLLNLYNDGFMVSMLFLAVIAFAMIEDRTASIDPSYGLAVLFSSVVLAANTKFTGLALVGVIAISWFLTSLTHEIVRSRRNPVFKKGSSSRIRIIGVLVGAFAVAVLLVGAPTYVTNYLQHDHPLYPLAGKDKLDIITTNAPKAFESLSNPEKLFISTFSKSANIAYRSSEDPELKVPFTLSPDELDQLRSVDLRVGGFGPFFSGILVISIAVCLHLIVRWSRSLAHDGERNFAVLTSAVLATVVPLSLLFPESWWARYSGYLYLLPIIALIGLFILWSAHGRRWHGTLILKVFTIGFALLIGVNTLLFFPMIYTAASRSSVATGEILELKRYAELKDGPLEVALPKYPGLSYNLKDAGLVIRYVSDIENPAGSAYLNQIVYR